MPTNSLPSRPNLDQLKHQARDLFKSLKSGDSSSVARVREAHPQFVREDADRAEFALSDAQLVIAREYGFSSWPELRRHVESAMRQAASEELASYYESLARDLITAFDSGDAESIQRLNEHYGRSFTQEDVRADVWHGVMKVREAKGRPGCFNLSDALDFISRHEGFQSWTAFVSAAGKPSQPWRIEGTRIAPRRHLSDIEWEQLIDEMRNRRLTELNAEGRMTDVVLGRVAGLEHVTRLDLGGSQQLSDEGLKQLARMPQLEHLDLSNYPGSAITDHGLEVLRALSSLRSFQICWQPRVTDVGIANLRSCKYLESVNLLGTLTGDGTMEALKGKEQLCYLQTGQLVTDAGLEFLVDYPAFKTWRARQTTKYSMMSADAEPTHLLLDGPFKNQGLKALEELEGIFGLSFFWHTTGLTPPGLKRLHALPNLGFLGCQGRLCDDEAMGYIASLPNLRMLMAQGTVATDDGFEALSHSRTIEYIWGRECPNLRGRGFAALSAMPALRGLAVSCKNVDDGTLAVLPRFPALKELMPMDIPDEGYRHVGQCQNLESLVLMYCRETTDAATEHLPGLSRLKEYFASYTKMTDRSMEILSGMTSLEKITFYGCPGVTDAGVMALARLPNLKWLDASGPNISPSLPASLSRVASRERNPSPSGTR